MAQAWILPPSSQQVYVWHLAAPSALLLMPYPLRPVVPLSVSPVTVLPSPSHRLSSPACSHSQDTPKKSCVYRSGYSFSRGCSYTCAKKIQVCLSLHTRVSDQMKGGQGSPD